MTLKFCNLFSENWEGRNTVTLKNMKKRCGEKKKVSDLKTNRDVNRRILIGTHR